jgi:HemY protein
MIRVVRYLILVSIAAAAAVWLASEPGLLTMDWRGWRIETSASVLIVAVVVFAAVVAVIYRGWGFLRRAPGRIGEAWRQRRRNQGYQALTRGMVAVAAGDADEAKRHGRRAEALLNDPPITMLLSAQAAQLAGDESAARRFFEAMTENQETAFMGLRGLLTQAIKDGDRDAALVLARRAYRLRPQSAWVVEALFDLQSRKGLWSDALTTTEQAARTRLIGTADSRSRRAKLSVQLALESKAKGYDMAWRKDAQTAVDLDPDLTIANLELARATLKTGKTRKAASLIEKAWGRQPHPDMVPHYFDAKGAKDALARVKAAERLAGFNRNHPESHLMIAEAAVNAQLWGEARAHLAKVTDTDHPSARACRLMAEIEEKDGGSPEAMRDWLVRASLADPEPSWVCGSCGNTVDEWAAVCGNCGTFGSFDWRSPPHVQGLPDETGAPAGTALPAPETSSSGTPALPAADRS